MKHIIALMALASMLSGVALADTVVMNDGTSLQGTFKSGTSVNIVFDVNGVSQTIPIASIQSMIFTARQAPPSSEPSNAPAPSPNAAPAQITLNAGTRIMVKTSSAIQTGSARTGDKFTAVLQTDLVVGNTVIAPVGATVYGRVTESVKAGRLIGVAKLAVELTDININNQLQPIVTEQLSTTGERQGSVKKLAAGAAVGGIADGSDGAKTGAAVGLAAAVMTKGKQIHVPAGTVVEFRLAQPVTVVR